MGISKAIRTGIKSISPPIFTTFVRRQFIPQAGERLFDGEVELFQRLLKDCSVYGEYGCGKSTLYVAEQSAAEIISVDSSKEWTYRIKAELPSGRNAVLEYVDCGSLGNWGRPLDYSKRGNYNRYTDFLWKGPAVPDLVLIDGRFRVACFLTSLMHAKPQSIILFDDYKDRCIYHVVEEFVEPFERCGRQFAFRVPATIDKDRIGAELERFRYVLD